MFGVVVATLVGVLFLLPFPSWAKLVGIVTSASVFMYAGAPVALGALRRQKPDLPRSYRLPAAEILAPLAFAGAGWVILFSGWQVYSTLVVALLLGYALIWASYALKLNPRAPAMDWQAAPWIIAWIVGMGVIAYLSDFGAGGIIGGIGIFKHVLDQGGTDDIGLWGGIIASGVVQPDHLLLGDHDPSAGLEGRRVRPRRLPAAGRRSLISRQASLPGVGACGPHPRRMRSVSLGLVRRSVSGSGRASSRAYEAPSSRLRRGANLRKASTITGSNCVPRPCLDHAQDLFGLPRGLVVPA